MNKFSLCFLICFSNTLFAQTVAFDMSAFGIKFGKMTVTKTKEDDSTDLYTLNAKGYLKILWMERNDETRYAVRYRHGKLISSSYQQIETGVIKKWTNVNFNGKQYDVDSYRGKRSFTEAPVFSIMSLYFNDPKTVNRIFYEAESDFATVNHPDQNTIEIKSSDGNRSIYRYLQGAINEMEFHISIATVYMKKVM
jgi:hypothetical protein